MALQQFFANVPEDCGMAFVVILHLAPNREGRLDEILQISTSMPVTQVTEFVAIRPKKVYVIPQARQLSLSDGHLTPSDRVRPLGRHAEIDLFFRTLGEAWGSHAACVLLSGMRADGSVGFGGGRG
jgi:two-component system CheB/CheR fusion protein